jgi:hypothetical protein
MNGAGVGLWMVLLMAVSATAGVFIQERYNILQSAALPDWFSQISGDDVTNLAIAGGILGLLAILVGTMLGGAMGAKYNQKVDAALTDRSTLIDERVRS